MKSYLLLITWRQLVVVVIRISWRELRCHKLPLGEGPESRFVVHFVYCFRGHRKPLHKPRKTNKNSFTESYSLSLSSSSSKLTQVCASGFHSQSSAYTKDQLKPHVFLIFVFCEALCLPNEFCCFTGLLWTCTEVPSITWRIENRT